MTISGLNKDFSDVSEYIFSHTLPDLMLETVLYGAATATLLPMTYVTCRPGIFPITTRVKDRLKRFAVALGLYIIFAGHWVLSLIHVWDLLSGSWHGSGHVQANFDDTDFGPMLLECAAFGVFCALSVIAARVQVQKNVGARSHKFMLATAIFMFASSLTHLALEIRIFALGQDNYTPQSNGVLGVFPLVLVSFNIVISDGIVLWRMCVFLGQNCYARLLSLCLVAATISLTIANLVQELGMPKSFLTVLASLGDFPTGTAVLGLSLTTNVISTCIIGWKTWRYRRDVAIHLAAMRHRSVAEKAMSVLVKSGVAYCMVWILYIIDSTSTVLHTRDSASAGESTHPYPYVPAVRYLGHLMAQFTGLYPIAVLVVVSLERRYLENTFTESRLSAFVATRPDDNQGSATASVQSRSARRIATNPTDESAVQHASMSEIADIEVARLSGIKSAGQVRDVEAANPIYTGEDSRQVAGSAHIPDFSPRNAVSVIPLHRPLPIHPTSTSTVHPHPAAIRTTSLEQTSDGIAGCEGALACVTLALSPNRRPPSPVSG